MKFFRKNTGYRFILPSPHHPHETRREKLVNILTHANATTPFYKNVFTTFLNAQKDFTDEEFFYAFSHLPIVEKQDLREKNEDFMSNHLTGKNDILQSGNTPSPKDFLTAIYKKDFFTTISTGGTSGTPTFRWLDYNDAQIFAHSFLDSFKRNGWSEGESFVVFYPLKSYFTGIYAQHAKTLSRYFGFTMVPFETITKETVENLLATLKTTKATLLVIFPCVLQRIAEIMHTEKIPPFEHLPCINVSGEFFLDCSKNFIQTKFPDSDIQSTYGAVEFGEIAHQTGLSSYDYDIFGDYVFAENGPDHSILITAYHQKAFPLVRYKIEDMGRVNTYDDGRQTLTSLEGKNSDYLIGADGYMYFASFFNDFINQVNKELEGPIIHFMLRHDQNPDGQKTMQLNFVLINLNLQEQVKRATLETIGKVFENYDQITVNIVDHFEHDYTRKFKIIGEGDGLAEVVGGYHQRKAS